MKGKNSMYGSKKPAMKTGKSSCGSMKGGTKKMGKKK
jgi:hypothetical protein